MCDPLLVPGCAFTPELATQRLGHGQLRSKPAFEYLTASGDWRLPE